MKLSKYVIYFDIDDLYGALFNTYNGSLVKIPNKLYKRLFKEKNSIEKSFLKRNKFFKEKFLVNDDDMEEYLKEKLNNNKFNKKKLVITFMTTMSCNLSCVYCYQRGIVDRSLHMDSNTSLKIKEWVKSKINNNKPEEVIFHFYGGEPLLNIDVMSDIVLDVMKLCSVNGAKFSSYITTNGVLLDKNKIVKLKSWNIDNAQISIDGPENIHNVRRCDYNNRGTYNIILKNIQLALEENIGVVIRVNIDRHNKDFVVQLFKELNDRGLHKFNNLQINLEIVSPIMNPSAHCKKYTFTTDKEMKILSELWSKQVEYGFPIKSAMPIDSACECLVENSFTISSNGDIYVCPGFIGIEDFKIGNIVKSTVDYDKYKNILKFDFLEKCFDCEYAPICQGGCKMCSFVNSKSYGNVYCRKEFIEHTYPEFLINKYNLRR